MENRSGLSLIELLISITIIAIIVGVGFMVGNPAGQVAGARNSERQNHLQAIMLAIRQNIAEQIGQSFSCAAGPIPTSTTKMSSGAGGYNIAPCIVVSSCGYGLCVMPVDPVAAGAHYSSNSDYDTGYFIMQNASTSQITLSAPSAELGQTITLVR